MKFETAYCLMINLYDYERRWNMMPLTFMNIGETKTITKVGGKNETRQFLERSEEHTSELSHRIQSRMPSSA